MADLERDLIKYIQHTFQQSNSHILRGIGDDAACIGGFEKIVISKDLLIEDVHFRISDISSYARIGRKALLVNISDLLSKFVQPPYYFFLGLGIPSTTGAIEIKSLLSGIQETLKEYESYLTGGDIVKAPVLTLSITVMGNQPKEDSWIDRNSLKAGDHLYLTGPLGYSAAGFSAQENGWNEKQALPFIEYHYSPALPVELIKKLYHSKKTPHMSMDLSDSMVETLRMLRSSDYTIKLDYSQCTDRAVRDFADRHNLNVQELALSFGEDYQILMAFDRKIEVEGLIHCGEVIPRQKQSIQIIDGANEIAISSLQHFSHFQQTI